MYNQIDSNKRKTVILIALFTAITVVIGWVFAITTDLGYGSLVVALVISIVMSLTSYFFGDKLALASAGARGPMAKTDNPYVFRLVENLAITAGLPLPKVYLINDPAINAFATGRNPEHASLAITSGAVEKLTNEELEGVIAHELSHIKNYDILLMTVVIVLIGMVALLSDWFFRFRVWGGRRGNSQERTGGQLQLILMVVGIIFLLLAPIIGQLIQLAISRKREYLADASGCLLTRYPAGLASALEKIQAEHMAVRKANTATAHLYIASPFGRTKHLMSNLFATHPPIEQRIAALRQMA